MSIKIYSKIRSIEKPDKNRENTIPRVNICPIFQNNENQDCNAETDELPEDGEQAAEETGEEQSAGEEASSQAEDSVEETAEEETVELSPEAELEKWRDIAARSQADLENYRKRMAREKSEAIQYANASLLSSLIPVIDNFEMGLKAAQN